MARKFGYEDAFLDELKQIQPLSSAALFESLFPGVAELSPHYSNEEAISLAVGQGGDDDLEFLDDLNEPDPDRPFDLPFDPSQALYFDLFCADPALVNEYTTRGEHAFGRYTHARSVIPQFQEFGIDNLRRRTHDFRLSRPEMTVFLKNGFVVSERMATASFAEAYYRIYTNDLPVFITVDSVLHAWHRSVDAIVPQIEQTILFHRLRDALDSMANRVHLTWKSFSSGPLRSSIMDIDLYLSVARALLHSTPSEIAGVTTEFAQDDNVRQLLLFLLGRGPREKKEESALLFGRERRIPRVLFEPEGHYRDNVTLQAYYRCLVWLNFIDFALAGLPSSPTELGAAVVLYSLALPDLALGGAGAGTDPKAPAGERAWEQFEGILRYAIGPSQTTTLRELGELLTRAELTSPAFVTSVDDLAQICELIAADRLKVHPEVFFNPADVPFKPEQCRVNRTFCLVGAPFKADRWALEKTVHGESQGTGLNVAFTALANNTIRAELQEQCLGNESYKQRLVAARGLLDGQSLQVWKGCLHYQWLLVLRSLSASEDDPVEPNLPLVMRNHAWQMKDLNTQLASWTQLHHDAAPQTTPHYRDRISCEYPAGYVEPRLGFWKAMERAADSLAMLMEKPIGGSYYLPTGCDRVRAVPLSAAAAPIAQFCRRFAGYMAQLHAIALRELQLQPLLEDQHQFLKRVMDETAGTGRTRYNGWYPRLFFSSGEDSGRWDPLTVEVLAAPAPVPGVYSPPVGALHMAVGNVHMMLCCMDTGHDTRAVYAGPVFSCYHFRRQDPARAETDRVWRFNLLNRTYPHPWWTREYLVAGVPEFDSDAMEVEEGQSGSPGEFLARINKVPRTQWEPSPWI
eukprot:gnl/Spiro4/11044_TR5852_c0_g1_i1.p1 gnl/Spiro4/11044_TR5852_c0_g1~~gnl/Spiro4/11044_TR5852_c0_g1_i1.p1  ORF type:complete len:857 (-),score=244.48 gnl/Spiro4/11044_TR5852_c0_g1_i1:59-2629(-)